MGSVTTIGLDLAKNVFQVHDIDAEGAAVIRQRLTRRRMLKFFAKLPRCLIGIPLDPNRANGITASGYVPHQQVGHMAAPTSKVIVQASQRNVVHTQVIWI